jgi:hypothetical protein
MLHRTQQNRFSSPLIATLVAILIAMPGRPAQAVRPTASRPVVSQVTAWSALPNQGLGNDGSPSVRVMAVVGSDLYVGGDFERTGDGTLTDLGNIARYNTSAGTWNALPNQGLNGYVYALAAIDSDLYVGGYFSQSGDGTLSDLGCIARYDTTTGTWHALPNQGMNNTVLELAVSGSDLYVGGYFSQSGDGTLSDLGCIARYDTTTGTWHALPNQGLGGGYWPMPSVRELAMSGSDLYVGGNFTRSGDGTLTNLGRVARYDTTAGTWHALPNQGLGGGSSPDVYALAMSGDDLYAGGNFSRSGDGTLTNLGDIARYNTATGTWHALPNRGLNDDVRALAAESSDLYVGGSFSQTGDGTLTNLGRIAHYDATHGTWNALPSQGLNDDVRALAAVGGDLYVGGDFDQSGDGTLTDLGCIVRGTSDGLQPEIQVLDGAVDIPDGTGNINFGATTVGTPIYKTFTVRNAGTADLALIEPIDVPAGFSVANSFGSTTLAPGSSTTFVVRLSAVAPGTYGGTLQFANNDSDENPFNFGLSGEVYHKVYLPLVIRL